MKFIAKTVSVESNVQKVSAKTGKAYAATVLTYSTKTGNHEQILPTFLQDEDTKAVLSELKAGDLFGFEKDVAGKISISKADSASVTRPRTAFVPGGGAKGSPRTDATVQGSIIRQNALTNAVNLVTAILEKNDVKDPVNKIIEVAKRFEAYTGGLLNGEATTEVPAQPAAVAPVATRPVVKVAAPSRPVQSSEPVEIDSGEEDLF